MQLYYVNDRAQTNGDHEVHEDNCPYMPEPRNRTFLGYFADCTQAITEAKKRYTQVNGCKTCCLKCHTQ